MKHDLYVTVILIVLFLLSHFVGLFIIKHYLPANQQLPFGIQKPEFEEKTSYIPILIAIGIATVIALILVKFSAFKLWKLWYFFSIFITLIIAFGAFMPQLIALILSLLFALIKIFKNNIFIHNITEIFVYGGLAAIFVPVLGIVSIIILLALISVYDAIAVWKTKHMISMAKFQVKSKMFSGLFVPYMRGSSSAINKRSDKTAKHENAILGGGDIAFPLMFSGVMLKNFGFAAGLITSITAALALLILFFLAKKKKFYPAMPFISAGCLFGYLIVVLIF